MSAPASSSEQRSLVVEEMGAWLSNSAAPRPPILLHAHSPRALHRKLQLFRDAPFAREPLWIAKRFASALGSKRELDARTFHTVPRQTLRRQTLSRGGAYQKAYQKRSIKHQSIREWRENGNMGTLKRRRRVAEADEEEMGELMLSVSTVSGRERKIPDRFRRGAAGDALAEEQVGAARRMVYFAHRTHFSHMSHPTFSHISPFILVFSGFSFSPTAPISPICRTPLFPTSPLFILF